MIVQVQAYKSSDGYIHATEEAAHKHDIRVEMIKLSQKSGRHGSFSYEDLIANKDEIIKILMRV